MHLAIVELMAKITAKVRRRVQLYRSCKQDAACPCFSDFIKNTWNSFSLKKMSLAKKCFIIIAVGLFVSFDQVNFMTVTAQANFSIDAEKISDEDIFVEKPLITKSEVASEIIEYVVQPGDSISSLSEKFHITASTITNANNLSRKAALDAGQKLKILPVTGLLHKIQNGDSIARISDIYDVPQELIRYQNDIDSDKELKVGKEIIVPNGIPPQPVSSKSSSGKKSSAPSAGYQDAPDGSAPETGGTFIWPAKCRVITRGFNPGISHWGLDCANSQGTPVYAADGGVVIKASVGTWGGGYGNHVIIDHGNGIKTIYGHLYSVGVQEGQHVGRGEGIGLMGTTGRSTGPHLHFEVIVNGKKTNPMKYL